MLISLFYFISGEEPYHGCTDIKPLLLLLLLLLLLFTKHSHHQNVTVIYLCQDMFPPGKYAKSISRNAHYIVAFKNPRDQLGMRNLRLQAFPTEWQNVQDTFRRVTNRTTSSRGGLSTRYLPGRAPIHPGRGYLAGRGSPRPGPSQPTRGGKQPRRGFGGRPSRGGKQPRRGRGRGGVGGGDSTPPSTDEDDESEVSTPRRRRMNQEGLQCQLEILLTDQRQTANGRRIAGITTTNTITTTYKDGGRPRVTRNSTSVRSSKQRYGEK